MACSQTVALNILDSFIVRDVSRIAHQPMNKVGWQLSPDDKQDFYPQNIPSKIRPRRGQSPELDDGCQAIIRIISPSQNRGLRFGPRKGRLIALQLSNRVLEATLYFPGQLAWVAGKMASETIDKLLRAPALLEGEERTLMLHYYDELARVSWQNWGWPAGCRLSVSTADFDSVTMVVVNTLRADLPECKPCLRGKKRWTLPWNSPVVRASQEFR